MSKKLFGLVLALFLAALSVSPAALADEDEGDVSIHPTHQPASLLSGKYIEISKLTEGRLEGNFVGEFGSVPFVYEGQNPEGVLALFRQQANFEYSKNRRLLARFDCETSPCQIVRLDSWNSQAGVWIESWDADWGQDFEVFGMEGIPAVVRAAD